MSATGNLQAECERLRAENERLRAVLRNRTTSISERLQMDREDEQLWQMMKNDSPMNGTRKVVGYIGRK